MTKEEFEQLVKEKEELLKNEMVKSAEIGSYGDFVEEFINPFLPEDQKIDTNPVHSKGWNGNSDNKIDFNKPFGIIVHF